MNTTTANLQPSHLTTKQIANVFNVSERMIYMARELRRTGRDDLGAECMAGRLTILGALKIAKPEKYAKQPDPLEALVAAWCRCDPQSQTAFLQAINAKTVRP